jgi:methionine-rich copper-binding protein CopC
VVLMLLAFVGLATLSIALYAAPALAHAELERSLPADGKNLSKQPGGVQLYFDEPVRAEFDPIKVTDENGDRVDEGDADTLTDDPDIVVAKLGQLPAGDYDVEWRVTSADGDPISGEYGFSVKESAVETSEDGRGAAPVGEEDAGGGGSLGVILGVLVVGGVAVAGFVVLRRR